VVGAMIDPLTGITPVMLIGAAFALPIFSLVIKSRGFYSAYSTFFTLLATIFTWSTLASVVTHGSIALYPFGGWPPPVGIIYEVDQFSAVLGALTASVMFLITLYSAWYVKEPEGCVWYYALLLGLDGGMLGCLFTGDAFNLFVMIEVLSISAYGLVAYYRSRATSLEASIKYAFIGAVATTMYFVALIFIYGSYGTLNMADIALRSRTGGAESLWGAQLIDWFSRDKYVLAVSAMVATILTLWAFTYKAALFPNHFWLPDAHPEAPTPVSAALSGLVVGVGVYAVMRWLYTVFGPTSILSNTIVHGVSVRDILLQILMVLGVISSIMGALLMNVQKDVKRLLAYSTISHVGLMFMGISVGLSNVPEPVRVLALTAVTYHLINHATGKSLLFLSTGVLIRRSGTRDMSKWGGVGKTCKAATSTMIFGAFNLLGVPPLGGFFSKLMLFQAFILSGFTWLAAVLVLESLISLVAYIKLVTAAIHGEPQKLSSLGTPHTAYITLTILAASCLALGIMYLLGYIPTDLYNIVNSSLSIKGTASYIEAARNLVVSITHH